MGPTTLFDKSFIQGLSVDESVWFDRFFLPVVCPMFFAETMSGLAKPPQGRVSPEEQIRRIADKFPDFSSMPCVAHITAAIGNLLGHPVPMNGQIPIVGGRRAKTDDLSGFVVDPTPESGAFGRWQNGEFLELERDFAGAWRSTMTGLDVDGVKTMIQRAGIDASSCKSFTDCRSAGLALTSDLSPRGNPLELAMLFIGAEGDVRDQILTRHKSLGEPRLAAFAPYAAYVLEVEVFFQVAVAAGLIGSTNPSNRLDIMYLFYLPFCMLFVSSDDLHRRAAVVFTREDQQFVWGPDLKAGLAQLNEHYLGMPEEDRAQGVLALAPHPPLDDSFFVTRIWDGMMPGWRERMTRPARRGDGPTAEQIMEMAKAFDASASDGRAAGGPDDAAVVTRKVRAEKGSWVQIPKHARE